MLVLGVIADGAKPWRPLADDDRYVRNALRKVNRYDGSVFVKTVPLAKLSGYGSLVNDLNVKQTPSVVVIDRNLKGHVLTGFVDRVAINQVIADARADSISPNISDDYLRWANELCGNYESRVNRWSAPTIPGTKAEVASMKRLSKIVRDYRHGIARKAAPAEWRVAQVALGAGHDHALELLRRRRQGVGQERCGRARRRRRCVRLARRAQARPPLQ